MDQLAALGFPHAAAAHFLEQCDGDVERAINALLANPGWQPHPDPEAASLAEAQRLAAADEAAAQSRREADEASVALVRQLTAADDRGRAGGGASAPPAYGSVRSLRGSGAGGAPEDLIDMEPEPESQRREPPLPPYSVDPPRSQQQSHLQQPHGHDDAALAAELARQDELAALQERLEKQERQMASERAVHNLEKEEIEQRLQEEKDDKERAMKRWQRDQVKAQRAEAAASTAVAAATQAAADAQIATGNFIAHLF